MTTQTTDAFDYLTSEGRAAAREYVYRRRADAVKLHQELCAKQVPHGAAQLNCRLYRGVRVVQDLSLTSLQETPAWGELHLVTDRGDRTFTIEEYPQLLAFVLARYW